MFTEFIPGLLDSALRCWSSITKYYHDDDEQDEWRQWHRHRIGYLAAIGLCLEMEKEYGTPGCPQGDATEPIWEEYNRRLDAIREFCGIKLVGGG